MVRQRDFRARAVAVCRPESSVFWMQIIHQIAKDLSALMYTYLPAEYTQGYTLPAAPDGFVCVSDYIAHFIQRYYEERGFAPAAIPPLSGFDNNAEYLNVAERITTVDVRPKTLGARLASKILFLLDHPGLAQEVSYVSSAVVYRGLLAEG